MGEIERLLTVVDLDDRDTRGHSAWAHLHAVLREGRRFVLLDDRGWSSSALVADRGIQEVKDTAKTVVGPDEPGPGETREQMEVMYWESLERKLREAGVNAEARELRALPHDVEIGERLRGCLAESS